MAGEKPEDAVGAIDGGVETDGVANSVIVAERGAQIQAPRFGVDADLLVGDGINSIEDLFAAVRNENPGVAEEVIRDAVRIVSQRVVDGDDNLFTKMGIDDGRTGAASYLAIKPRTIDIGAVKQAVQAHLMGAHMPGGRVNQKIADLRGGLADAVRAGAEELERSAVFLDRKDGRDRLVVKPHESIKLDPEKDNG